MSLSSLDQVRFVYLFVVLHCPSCKRTCLSFVQMPDSGGFVLSAGQGKQVLCGIDFHTSEPKRVSWLDGSGLLDLLYCVELLLLLYLCCCGGHYYV